MKRYKMEEMEEHNVLEMAALTLEDLVVAHKEQSLPMYIAKLERHGDEVGGDGGAHLSGDGCPRLVGEGEAVEQPCVISHPHITAF